MAVIGTQTIAVLISVYGILLPAIGWGDALFIICYAIIAFLITDFLKVPFCRLLDRTNNRFATKPKQ